MFLKELAIFNGSQLIRSIPFKKGLNLIVDETTSDEITQSGNNVGKTTVLRLIDFCLGSDGKNIYTDPEYKGKNNSNAQIESFLKDNNVIVSLTLVDDLDKISPYKVEIKRNFLNRKDKILEINGEAQKNNEFPTKLKELIFKSNSEKPKFRQIVAKNIRDEKNRVVHTLKVLSPYTTIEEYESVFLFWLGIETDFSARKQQLVRSRTNDLNLLNRLKKDGSLSQIEQSLIVVDRNIKSLNKRKEDFNVNEDYESDLKRLNEVKLNINRISTKISNLEMRKDLALESKLELENETSDIDENKIKSLYNEAKILVPNIQKTFEETLNFHNEMIQKKIEYISEEIPFIEEELKRYQKVVTDELLIEKQLANKLRESGAAVELEKIVAKLNENHERKGKLEEQKRLLESVSNRLEEVERELEEINNGVLSKEDLMKNRIKEFNKFFSALSLRLYGESFILSEVKHDRGYGLAINSVMGNPGTGMKKGEIAAFDLSYIQFADELDIPCLHFVLQDQIENVHDNQISNLLTEIVAEINCQYVLPVLKDKLPNDIDVKKFEVVSLSQKDKLFKVE
jgi:uncharacterized protein YydD (DUF2326 family)